MKPVDYHPLVSQLLRSVGASESVAPSMEAWRELLTLMSEMHYKTDRDRDELETSIENSAHKMQELERKVETERVEQDAILRATLEAAEDGIMLVDYEQNVIAVNRRFVEMGQIPDEVVASRD
jgi:PAS domain-containing protein